MFMFFTMSNQPKIMMESGFQVLLFENDFKSLFPELFLILSTLFLLIYGVILGASKEHPFATSLSQEAIGEISSVRLRGNTKLNSAISNKAKEAEYKKKAQLSHPLLLQNMSWLSLLCLVYALALLQNNFLSHGLVLYGSLILDDFTLFLKILVICGAFFSILISLEYFKGENINFFESIILIMISTCSMLLLICSADFISMYLAIELQSFCFYIMAASKRNSEFSTEAGLKYFLLGAFSSGILLFGCSLIYGFTGITTFSELAKLFTCGASEFLIGPSSLRGCELGMIFIIVGFLFKITAAPFHMWAPDVYEGAPTSVTAFFSIVPKISILAVFVRLFLDCFFDFMLPWQKIIIFSSLASMVVGALAALSQNRIKRFLAFSSVGHVGYLLIGFCCGTMEGLQSLLIYLIVYVIMTLTLFALILSPVERNFSNTAASGVQRVKYITDFAQLGKTNSMLAFTLTVTMFSIAGIPPLAGFYSKAALFFAAMSSGMYLLAIVGVLTSVLSCFYYIRLVKIMYFESSKEMRTIAYTKFEKLKKELLLGAFSTSPTQTIKSSEAPALQAYAGSTLGEQRVELTKPSKALSEISKSNLQQKRAVLLRELQELKTKLSSNRARGASSQIFSRISKENSITLGLTLLFIMFFLIYPSPLYLATHKVALSLCV